MTTLPLIRRAVPIPYERYNSTTPSRKVSSLPHDRFYSACVAEWQHSMRACPVTFVTNQQHRFACSPHRTTVHFRAAPTNQRAIVGRLWKMPVMRQNTPPWKVVHCFLRLIPSLTHSLSLCIDETRMKSDSDSSSGCSTPCFTATTDSARKSIDSATESGIAIVAARPSHHLDPFQMKHRPLLLKKTTGTMSRRIVLRHRATRPCRVSSPRWRYRRTSARRPPSISLTYRLSMTRHRRRPPPTSRSNSRPTSRAMTNICT